MGLAVQILVWPTKVDPILMNAVPVDPVHRKTPLQLSIHMYILYLSFRCSSNVHVVILLLRMAEGYRPGLLVESHPESGYTCGDQIRAI